MQLDCRETGKRDLETGTDDSWTWWRKENKQDGRFSEVKIPSGPESFYDKKKRTTLNADKSSRQQNSWCRKSILEGARAGDPADGWMAGLPWGKDSPPAATRTDVGRWWLRRQRSSDHVYLFRTIGFIRGTRHRKACVLSATLHGEKAAASITKNSFVHFIHFF